MQCIKFQMHVQYLPFHIQPRCSSGAVYTSTDNGWYILCYTCVKIRTHVIVTLIHLSIILSYKLLYGKEGSNQYH